MDAADFAEESTPAAEERKRWNCSENRRPMQRCFSSGLFGDLVFLAGVVAVRTLRECWLVTLPSFQCAAFGCNGAELSMINSNQTFLI